MRIVADVETVTPAYDKLTFRRMFRLARSTVDAVLREIDEPTKEQPHRGRPLALPKKYLLLALGFMGTKSTLLASHCGQNLMLLNSV